MALTPLLMPAMPRLYILMPDTALASGICAARYVYARTRYAARARDVDALVFAQARARCRYFAAHTA